jgi:hypothetical protein
MEYRETHEKRNGPLCFPRRTFAADYWTSEEIENVAYEARFA